MEGRFQTSGGNNIGFRLGSYDHARALVIDPALAYSTYLGGSGPCLNPGLSSAGTDPATLSQSMQPEMPTL